MSTRAYMPSLDGATEWLNSEPLGRSELLGHVVLVHSWTLTCINWLRTQPYIRAWAQAYRDDGAVCHWSPHARLTTVEGTGVEAEADWAQLRTPETYLGYRRNAHFASPDRYIPGESRDYHAPERLSLNRWTLEGRWTIGNAFTFG